MNVIRLLPWILRLMRLHRGAQAVRQERGGGRVTGYDAGKAAGRTFRKMLK